MSIEEIVNTCSHEKVAQAAVASLGVDFATRVRTEAERHGVATGALVARIVREFGAAADAGERRAVYHAMDRMDQPLLCGLRFILEARLRAAQSAPRETWPISPPASSRPTDFAVRHVG